MNNLELPPTEQSMILVAKKLYEILEREYHRGNKPITPEQLMLQAIKEAELV